MMSYLKIDEVKKRLEHLATYELNVGRYYEIADRELNKNFPIKHRMINVYKKLLEQVSTEMNLMDEHMNLTPSCRLGCAFCCYFPIIITRLEAKMIIYSIENLPNERREELINHLKAYFEENIDLINKATELDLVRDDVKSKYVQMQLPCPLLNTETNSCIAYEVRPLPCRTYVNYIDPKVCEDELMPNEAVSFEFLYEEYMGALNEAAKSIYFEENPTFLDYPTDLYEINYLPVFLREWINNM